MSICTLGSLARCSLALALTVWASAASSITAPPALVDARAQANMLDSRVNLKSAYAHSTGARPGLVANGLSLSGGRSRNSLGAFRKLVAVAPGITAKYSQLTGAPVSLSNGGGWLTNALSNDSSESIVRQYLRNHADVFGLTSQDQNDLVVLGDSSGGSSGLRMLRIEQQIDGVPVFQSESRFMLSQDGRLSKYVGQLIPFARSTAPDLSTINFIDPGAAVVDLLAFEGHRVDLAGATSGTDGNGRITLSISDDYIAGDVTARKVLFPISPGVLIPAWSLVVFTSGQSDWYAVVDAETGDLLWRKNIRSYDSAQDARFRVYVQADGVSPAASPAPLSPTTATPGSNFQAPAIAPTIVSMHTAYDPVASPNGWINDCPAGGCTANETQTLGNNVLVCIDQVQGTGAANVCDTTAVTVIDGNGRPTGNPDANGRNRDFLGTAPRDFQTNFLPPPQGGNPEAGQTVTGNGNNGTLAIDGMRRGVMTHLFYTTNWYHDQLYKLGFDEASGNFQQTNFSGMGLGNDRINGDADDGSGTNNANFATPPDGTSGRMQMYRFTGPTIDRDGAIDAEISMHEMTHGTSNRLIGDGAGLNWDPASGMGEGWSDFYALSLLNNTNASDPNAAYATGGYATYKLTSTYLDNYSYGIRRFPYSTNHSINPLTWADVDDVTNNLSGGIAPDPLGFNNNGGMEVHNIGEVWALTLWGVRSRVIADPAGANGDVPTGNHRMLQLTTDALKMTPINPTFTDARNAFLDADCATNACANEDSIWSGFADRGLGYGAQAPYAIVGAYVTSHQGVHESFAVPFLDVVTPATDLVFDDSAGNANGKLDPGEAVKLTVKLTNPWRAASKAVASATATLTTSTPGVSIYTANSTFDSIAPAATASGSAFVLGLSPSVACGSAIDFTLTTTSSLGTTSTNFRVRVGVANGTDPVVTYTGTPSPALVITDAKRRGSFHQITVTDDLEIADLNFRIDALAAPAVGDLTVLLRSPDGIGTDLISLVDGLNDFGGTAMTNTVIDDDVGFTAATDLVEATTADAPYTKSWSAVFNAPWAALVDPTVPADPIGNLSRYIGKSTKGTWTTLAADVFSAAQGGKSGNGSLSGWSIQVTPVHFQCSAFTPSTTISATNTVAGTFKVGGTVTYTIVLTNNGTANQADNAGHEFSDILPAALSVVSATATSGTATSTGNTVSWDGSLAPLGGSTTITITATINAGAQGTTISDQGSVSYDSNADGSNDATVLTDDPEVGGTTDPTSFTVGAASLTASKTVSGIFQVGSTVTYSIVLSNSGNSASLDNPGNEFTDVLPSGLVLISASSTAGASVASGNTATWNGSVPAGGSVSITITASIAAGAQGTTISNQGSVFYDADLDGTNETMILTDDPAIVGAANPTSFSVGTAHVTATKTVSGVFQVGGTVTYTIVLTNSGSVGTPDNAGNELTDVLPSGVTLTGASASSGTAVAAANTVTWNGIVPAAGTVTITITAKVNAGTQGTSISNQASFSYDADLNGSNETTVLTDDPSVGGSSDPTVFVASAGGYIPLSPGRILDTRVNGATVDGLSVGTGRVAGDTFIDVPVLGRGGVAASGVKAVVVNVTVTNPQAEGFLSVWPSGTTRPLASNLNFTAGVDIPNSVIAQVGSNGSVSVYVSPGTLATDLVVDVQGYFSDFSSLQSLVPARILDTRLNGTTSDGNFAGLGAVPAQQKIDLTVSPRSSVPATGVGAVIMNVTATNATTEGFATIWPTGAGRPATSSLNFVRGVTVPNLVISQVGSAGQVSLFNSAGTTDFVADVQGWFPISSELNSVEPARVLDTRAGQVTVDGLFQASGPVAASGQIDLQVAGRGGVPASGVGAVVLNVTVTQATQHAFITVWPSGAARPFASNLNVEPTQTIANMVIAKVGSNGQISIYNSAGTTEVIADVVAWLPQAQ